MSDDPQSRASGHLPPASEHSERLASGIAIALDVGGTSVKSGLVDGAPAVVGAVWQTPVDNGAGADELLDVFRGIVARHVAELGELHLRGVGAAFPNPFDYGRGVSLMRHKYAALYGVDVGAAIRSALPDPSLPVAFRNDAEAAVVGEASFGSGRPYSRVIGITLGTGLGACFVASGQAIREGPDVPAGGELWDQTFRSRQADDWFSIRGLQARLGSDDIPAAARLAGQGDAIMRAGLASFGEDLGLFLAPFVAQFRAEGLLVLGGLAGAGEHFLPALRASLPVPALLGARGTHAALLGAAAPVRRVV